MQPVPLSVPDTSVLVSGATFSADPASSYLDAIKRLEAPIALSEPILAEVERIFGLQRIRQFTGMSQAEASDFVVQLREIALIVPGTTLVSVSPDPNDNMFFACAVEAGATHIVSDDTHHILPIMEYHGVRPLPPGAFMAEYFPASSRL